VSFSGWAGAVDCAGMGDCDELVCHCTTSTGTGPFEVVAIYTAEQEDDCVPPAAP
jgi:hypothetical protein